MIGRKHQRNLEIILKRNILWDVYNLSVEVFYAKSKKVKNYKFGKDHNKMYENQTRHMIKIIRKIENQKLLEDGIHK